MMVVPSTLKTCGTRHEAKTSEAIYITDTVNPQADIQPTWKCEIWVRDVDLLKPGSNKDSEGEPKIPEHITCQAACTYDIYGKCTGMLSLERLNILLHAYNQFNGLAYTVLHNHLCKTRQLKL
jgi:hypothetical protein